MKNGHFNIGCSGWYYRHWRGVVYPDDLPTTRWLSHYQQTLDTVELNAPFYRWPRPNTVRNWVRQATPGFRYSIKVNRRITHLKRFNGTKKLVREFCQLAEVLAKHMGCFLFQLPPSFHYTEARLRTILDQLDPHHRNAVEFRHASWWNEDVYAAFREARAIFCSISAPHLPDDLIQTTDTLYVRFHGVNNWYRYDYSTEELNAWAKQIRASRAKEVWAYFNNDSGGSAFRNAQTLREVLCGPKPTRLS